MRLNFPVRATSIFVFLVGCLPALTLADEPVRPVGTFGGFIGENGPDIPENNGFLTFSADSHVNRHRLKWQHLLPGRKDFLIGEMVFHADSGNPDLKFVDWSTLEASTREGGVAATAYLSRTFPAVRYESQAGKFTYATALDGRERMSRIAMVQNDRIRIQALSGNGPVSGVDSMSEPWVLLWAADAAGWSFDVPILLTFENRPASISATPSGIDVAFDGEMGAVNVMPLMGLTRYATDETRSWRESLPDAILFSARSFVSKLAAFPVGMTETYSVDEDAGRVTVRASYRYRSISDAWGTVPERVAPLPPVVVRAGRKGYPVSYPEQEPMESELATFYGPFAYVPGASAAYELPLPHALSRLPVPLRVENSALEASVREELEGILSTKLPDAPSDFHLQNDDRAAAALCDALPTFEKGHPLRKKARELAPLLLRNSYSNEALAESVEPVTGQRYLSPKLHGFGKAPFDREWYIGRQLAALASCTEALGPDLARELWPAVLGMYRYNQMFFDWVTGSVLSSVYGINQLADGIQFAWEGVLGVARMARLLGDRATFEDAAYRSARQQAALFGIWHQAEWSRKIDYGIAHFSAEYIPPEQIETDGAVDAWVEDFGSATLEMRSFWQTANFIFYDIPAQFSFYRDFGIDSRVRKITYEIMPERHPNWKDGNAYDPVDKRFYGSGYLGAHLLARAALFHHDPAELFSIYKGIQGTRSEKQWYTIYFYGVSVPLLLGIERAKAPVVEVPVAKARLESSVFDANTGKVTLDLVGRADGRAEVRIRSLKGEWSAHEVELSKDRKIRVEI